MRVFLSIVRISVLAALVSACGGGGGDGGGGGTPPTSGGATAIQAVSNNAAPTTPAGTTSPVTLVAKVTNAAGSGVSGVTVTWSVSAGTITPPTSTSDASGQATAQWTLGTATGTQTAAATATGVGTSASFTANVVAGALAHIALAPDSIVLGSIGETAVVIAAATDAFSNVIPAPGITYTSDNPTVATVNSSGTITLQGAGRTNIRATAGSVTAAIPVRQVCFGVSPLSLAVGAVATLTGTAAGEFCVQGASGSEFVAIPFFAPLTSSGITLTIKGIGDTPTSGPPTPSISTSRFRSTILAGGRELTRDEDWERQFRERSLQLMTPKIADARRMMQESGGIAGRRSISFAAIPSVGDIMTLNVNDGPLATDACTTPINHGARVMAVSNRAIVVNDTLNPTGGFTSADFQSVADAFDNLVYPTDTQNFGEPTDIDGNGRVILLFTRAVNELTPASNTTSFIGGFFYNRDIFPKVATARVGACATSNFAEMFYLLTPDPTGSINSHQFSASFVKSITIGTVAHEFQHLINASRHVYVNTLDDVFETVFLDEGLAHEAEELTFYAASGLSPRQNLDSLALVASPTIVAAANNYASQNQKRFRLYLQAPESNSPYANNDDLATRGSTWSFLRYATDRLNGTDSNTWFALVNPNQSGMQGVANLQRVFGSNLATQIRDWSVANYVDDAVAGVPAINTHPSWNTRSVEEAVNGPGFTFPLKTQQMISGSQIAITLVDGGSSYLRFGVPNAGLGGGIITSASGGLPAAFSLSIVRTK